MTVEFKYIVMIGLESSANVWTLMMGWSGPQTGPRTDVDKAAIQPRVLA